MEFPIAYKVTDVTDEHFEIAIRFEKEGWLLLVADIIADELERTGTDQLADVERFDHLVISRMADIMNRGLCDWNSEQLATIATEA